MTKFKCKCCKKISRADKRNYWKQEYCSKPECKRESKKQSNRKYMQKPENIAIYSGAAGVQRVQAWRKEHPGYSKRKKRQIALQDVVNLQSVSNKEDTSNEISFTLQDVINSQPALLLGVIAQFTGHALQEDITPVVQKMIQRGMQILQPQIPYKEGDTHGKENFAFRPVTNTSQAMELG